MKNSRSGGSPKAYSPMDVGTPCIVPYLESSSLPPMTNKLE